MANSKSYNDHYRELDISGRDDPSVETVALFTAEWERLQGYKPAPFQKAIAMQRLERGQSVREIIDYLVASRV